MPEKKEHRLLSALLELTHIRNQYVAPYTQLKRQSAWIIELAGLFEPCDQQGHVRTTRQVKREVNQFLKRLEQEAAQRPDATKVITSIVKAVHHRWWGLFTCYQVSHVTALQKGLLTAKPAKSAKDFKDYSRGTSIFSRRLSRIPLCTLCPLWLKEFFQ